MIFRYDHPEKFMDLSQPNYTQASGNIILYGAGVNGAIVMRLLEKRGVRIIGFTDSDARKHGTKCFGYNIISPREMRDRYPDAVVIVTPYVKGRLFEDLQAAGHREVYDCAPLLLEFNIDDVRDAVPPIVDIFHAVQGFLNRRARRHALTVVITERCTLRCRECQAFIPYYENPVDYDFAELRADFRRVFSLDIFPNVYLEGGEPMLHRDFQHIIEELVSYDSVERLWVITNGTIVPEDNVLRILKNPKIIVWISDYKEHSYNINKLKEQLRLNEVVHHSTTQHWYAVTQAQAYDRNEAANQLVYDDCCKGLDMLNPFLMRSRIYRCQFHASSEIFGVLPVCEDDSVDISKESNTLRKEINALLSRKNYLEACRYCCGRGFASIEVPVAEQMTGNLPSLKKMRGSESSQSCLGI